MSRRYTEADLKGLTKNQLVRIIESEPQHIPKPFNRSKIPKAALIKLLLSPTTPFRTSDPPLDEEGDNLGQENQHNDADSTTPSSQEGQFQREEADRYMGGRSQSEDREPEEGDHGNLDIRLYIEDRRYPGSVHEKTSKTIHVEGVVVGPNAVQIQTFDIVRELQAGFGAIAGKDPVRVGLQDPISPDYTEFFAESHPSMLHMCQMDPSVHVIRVEPGFQPSLRLRVDFSHPEAKRLEVPHAVDQSAHTPSSVPLAPNDRTKLIQWLRSKAAEQDEYEVFCQSKHHVRQNSNACQSWKFAAEFSRHYYKQIHPFPLISGKIKKSDIYQALEVGETWLSQAEEVDRIIQIFGEGGTHPSPEVIVRLSADVTESPQGSVQLLQFLRDWNKTHHPDLL